MQKATLPKNAYFFVVAFYPYIFLFNHFLNTYRAFGKNLYILFVFAILLFLFYSVTKRLAHANRDLLAILLLLILSVLLTFFLRLFFFGESPSRFFQIRYSIMMIIYLILPKYLIKSEEDRETLQKIVIVNTFIQALIGIVHFAFLPSLITGDEELMVTGELFKVGAPVPLLLRRESGILGNPSIYANFVLVGFYVFLKRDRVRNIPLYLAILIVYVVSIILSVSRFPILFAALILLVFLFSKISLKKGLTLLLLLLLAVTQLSSIGSQLYNRFFQEESVRRSKNALALWLLLNDERSNLLLGVPDSVISTERDPQGRLFSDNSYLTLLTSQGVFVFAALGAVTIILIRVRDYKRNLLLPFYFFGVLLFTNGILWDVWEIYYFAALTSLKTSPQSKMNHDRAIMAVDKALS